MIALFAQLALSSPGGVNGERIAFQRGEQSVWLAAPRRA